MFDFKYLFIRCSNAKRGTEFLNCVTLNCEGGAEGPSEANVGSEISVSQRGRLKFSLQTSAEFLNAHHQ